MFSEYLIMATQNIWPEESCCRHFLCKLISNSWISAPPLHQCNLVDLICVECYCSHAFKFTYFPPSCVSFFVEPGFVSWFSRGLYFAATIPLLSIKKSPFQSHITYKCYTTWEIITTFLWLLNKDLPLSERQKISFFRAASPMIHILGSH